MAERNGDDTYAFEPYRNPVDRFAHLPESTRQWLEQLRDEDLADMREAIRFQRSVKTVGRFFRWLIITIFGCFLGAATLGDAVIRAWHSWIQSGGK